ncbi:MAG: VWA domain-containing protein [Planctomycetaceae bacterium]|nr:VWA domain-containing protein [Planctomycetaceae bacterium]
MPSFLAGAFAAAGAIAALGPVVIHLLNRRRYKVVSWAAMDLLREATLRRQRSLRLRDLLLLTLRVLCVLMFGLALARPYFSSSGRAADPGQSVHAVLVVDNSLSMSYGELGGSLLEQARAQAADFVDRLPEGSRISILPLCGPLEAADRELYQSAADARDALARIEPQDRSGTVTEAIDLARAACAQAPELPAKRIVFLSDQQRVVWPTDGLKTALRELPEFQVIPVQAGAFENAWVADLRVQDEIADTQSPAIVLATIRYDGPAIRKDVEVVLEVDGAPAATQIVDLIPGQAREVRFTHQFAASTQSDVQAIVPVSVSLTPDRLTADDARFLAVPVLTAAPVVFVDQFGAAGENPRLNRFGETYHLRRLLAPATGHSDRAGSSAGVRHLTVDQLTRDALQDARLVVMAGVESPLEAVSLLREYVEQGGQLLIAAGGEFSPAAWNKAAWLNGAGLLPGPLNAEFVGQLPDPSQAELNPFLLSPASMADEFFSVDGASREEMEDLYRTPIFFRAVEVRVDGKADVEGAAKRASSGGASDNCEKPDWLRWRKSETRVSSATDEATLALREAPRVLAGFSNQIPFLVERRIGDGNVLFASSGVSSNWNNLPRTNAILIFDRLLRRMIGRTLPRRNFDTFEQFELPVASADRRAQIRLERSSGPAESLLVDALGPDQYGVTLRNLNRRGLYQVVAERTVGETTTASEKQRLWQIPFAVNGPARESELATIDETVLRQGSGPTAVHWGSAGDPIRLEGADVRGQNLWRALLWGTMIALLAETACLAATRPVADPVAVAVPGMPSLQGGG